MRHEPTAHCGWGDHEAAASSVHVMADDDTACEVCIHADQLAKEEERPMAAMSVEKVKMRLERIRWQAEAEADSEAAHGLEDDLWSDVLRAIAANECDDPVNCARLALTTADIRFKRDCA